MAARTVDLRECFSHPVMAVMPFLNEIVAEFPDAISFAPGRPLDDFFDLDACLAAVQVFIDRTVRAGPDRRATAASLGQYSGVNGMIGELVAAHLARDEHIHVDPASIVVTVGAQEAMAIVLAGLFEPGRDVLLVSDPSYIGITGLARMFGVDAVPVRSADEGLDPEDVERAIVAASRIGRVRGLYDIPDFNNPLGTTLPLDRRLALLEVCERHGVLLIEDGAYAMFAYDAPRLPALKALDRSGAVLYIGSFAKTLAPGLRLGYLVADQREGGASRGGLAAALARVKSLLTVNTPPLTQAIAAGLLIGAGGSLEPIVAPRRARYKQHRDALAAALTDEFADTDQVRWRVPAGGFFMPVTLPFAFGSPEMRRCALDHGVIACPMRYFSLDGSRGAEMRLSFSAVEPPRIREGVARLARFVRQESLAPVARTIADVSRTNVQRPLPSKRVDSTR